jgi:butyryl-CoA dehydrogenase
MRGISAFIVEKDTPGFTIGKREDTMGIRTVPVNELEFKDCRIPASALLGGKEGGGFKQRHDDARPRAPRRRGSRRSASRRAPSNGRCATRWSAAVRPDRAVACRPSSSCSPTWPPRSRPRAARLPSAALIDSGAKNINKIAAMGKVFATDTAMKVATDAVQLFGGYGFCKDYPIEKYMRDAKITQIYEGTNQVQRLVIGRAITNEYSKIDEMLDVKVEHFPDAD